MNLLEGCHNRTEVNNIWVPENPNSTSKAHGIHFDILFKSKCGNNFVCSIPTHSCFSEDSNVCSIGYGKFSEDSSKVRSSGTPNVPVKNIHDKRLRWRVTSWVVVSIASSDCVNGGDMGES